MKTLAIRDWARNGFYNMAADVCSMKLVETGYAESVFRTYTWEPHCLSIGRFQRPSREADVNRILSDGYHIVRRPTGGRAVWHGDELTYSLVAREDHPLVAGGIGESLKKVAGILIAALESVGIAARLNLNKRELSGAGRIHNPCFTSHGIHEVVTSDGRKLVGSAQARSRGVFLEHGSILFSNDQTKAADYLPAGAGRVRREQMQKILAEGVGTVSEFNGKVTKEELAETLHAEFAKAAETEPVPFSSSDLPDLTRETRERRELIETSKEA